MRPKKDYELFTETAGTDLRTAEQDYEIWQGRILEDNINDLYIQEGVVLKKNEFSHPVFLGLFYAQFLFWHGTPTTEKDPTPVNAKKFYFPRGHAIHNGQ